jgi:hypothetical protein
MRSAASCGAGNVASLDPKRFLDLGSGGDPDAA